MARIVRDWHRLAESYNYFEHHRQTRQESGPSLMGWIRHRILMVKYQFLPHYGGSTPKWRLQLRSLIGPRVLPDFACVGAIKSGTSDLSIYLFQHPSILPPLTKEIASMNTRDWPPHYPTVKEMERVAKETGMARSGYFGPSMNHLPLIDGYHAVKPDAKIVIMLRNPVDRAYSHYKWDLAIGGKRLAAVPYYRTFADYVNMALDLFPATPLPSRCRAPFLQTGIYVKSVQLWMDRFGRENVYILRSEDFFKDPAASVCGIHEFLGLPPIKPEIHEVVNRNGLTPPPLEEEARNRLRDFYRPWNEKLYAVIGQDYGWS